jgi:hypothetical protein
LGIWDNFGNLGVCALLFRRARKSALNRIANGDIKHDMTGIYGLGKKPLTTALRS